MKKPSIQKKQSINHCPANKFDDELQWLDCKIRNENDSSVLDDLTAVRELIQQDTFEGKNARDALKIIYQESKDIDQLIANARDQLEKLRTPKQSKLDKILAQGLLVRAKRGWKVGFYVTLIPAVLLLLFVSIYGSPNRYLILTLLCLSIYIGLVTACIYAFILPRRTLYGLTILIVIISFGIFVNLMNYLFTLF